MGNVPGARGLVSWPITACLSSSTAALDFAMVTCANWRGRILESIDQTDETLRIDGVGARCFEYRAPNVRATLS